MNSDTVFNLSALYDSATEHTREAIAALEAKNLTLAYASLEKRKDLVRKIQRGMDHAPAWGDDNGADLAALRYIQADKTLETVLDRLG